MGTPTKSILHIYIGIMVKKGHDHHHHHFILSIVTRIKNSASSILAVGFLDVDEKKTASACLNARLQAKRIQDSRLKIRKFASDI